MRQTRRFPVNLIFSYLYEGQEDSSPGAPKTGTVRNISTGGVLAELLEAPPEQARLRVTLVTEKGSLRAVGEVVWVRPHRSRDGQTLYLSGIRFCEMDAGERVQLEQYLAHQRRMLMTTLQSTTEGASRATGEHAPSAPAFSGPLLRLSPREGEVKEILVVDDDKLVVATVKEMLEGAGHTVHVALDGEEGLSKARTLRLDLIVLDVMMPKLDGFEVANRLKEDPRYQHIPILMLTALASHHYKTMFKRFAADAYMQKPVHYSDFLRQVERLLSPQVSPGTGKR